MIAACSNNQSNVNDENERNQNIVPVDESKNGVENIKENNDIMNEEEETNDGEESIVEPLYRIAENWSIVPIDDSVNEQVVLLTIDDAPEHHALEMAKTLKELDAPAIFFVNGHFLETDEQKDVLKRIHDMGFVIGNHTYSHKNLANISREEQKEEIIRVSNMVEEIIGERPKFFRPPHGVYTDYAKDVIMNDGMAYMNWTYGYDWEADYMSKEAITDIMINSELLRNGSNLLMHDREWTADALHDIVLGLRDKGYEVVDPELIETMN